MASAEGSSHDPAGEETATGREAACSENDEQRRLREQQVAYEAQVQAQSARDEDAPGGVAQGVLGRAYLASKDLLAEYGHWQRPDDKVATARYHKHHTHHAVYEPAYTQTNDLRVFGEGHVLYFYFLRFMASVFCMLAVVPALLAVIVFALGPWYSGRADVENLMLGNFGLASSANGSTSLGFLLAANEYTSTVIDSVFTLNSFDAAKSPEFEVVTGLLFRTDNVSNPASLPGGGSKTDTLVALSVIDMLAVLAFFGFCLYFITWTYRKAKKTLQTTVTIKNYSVRVRDVPHDVDVEDLWEHFSKYGEVARIDLAYACFDLMDMVMERHKTIDKCERALAVLQRSAEALPKVEEAKETALLNHQYDLQLVNRAIQNQQDIFYSKSTGQRSDIVGAFVVYKEEVSKELCLKAQPTLLFGCIHRPMPEELLFLGKHPLRVMQAPEPTDLKYENLEISDERRAVYWFVSWLLKLLILLVGFVLVGLSPAIKHNLGAWESGTPVETCNQHCSYDSVDGVPQLDDATRNIYRTCHETGLLPDSGLDCEEASVCYECYCRMVIISMLLSEAAYCSEYKGLLAVQIGSQALAVLTIVAVNVALPWIIERLSQFEKHHVRTAEARSATRAILIMYVLNTSSIVIANAYFPNLRRLLEDNIAGKFLFLGIYSDLSPNWYTDVARPIAFSQYIGILGRAAREGVVLWWTRHKRAAAWKSLTQRQLNNAHTGPEFVLASRYGEHLGVIFITLLYSAAIPVLFWSCTLSFIVAYFLEKYMLLKVCRNPIAYSPHLGIWSAEVLPLSVPLHLFFAFWAYSFIAVPRSIIAPSLVYGWISSISSGLQPLWANTNMLTSEQMADRVAQANALHLLLFALISLLVLLIVRVLTPLLRPHLKKLRLRWLRRKHMRWLPRMPWGADSARVAPAAGKGAHGAGGPVAGRMELNFPGGSGDGGSSHGDEYDDDGNNNIGVGGVVEADKAKLSTAKRDVEDADSVDDLLDGIELIGVPELDIAVRSKLLTGPDSYDMTTLEAYEDAFRDIVAASAEELDRMRAKLEARAAAASARGAGASAGAVMSSAGHRRLRERADRLANVQAAGRNDAPGNAAGQAGQAEHSRQRSQEPAGRMSPGNGRSKGNGLEAAPASSRSLRNGARLGSNAVIAWDEGSPRSMPRLSGSGGIGRGGNQARHGLTGIAPPSLNVQNAKDYATNVEVFGQL